MKKLSHFLFLIMLLLAVSICCVTFSNGDAVVYAEENTLNLERWYDAEEYNDYVSTLSAINNMLSNMSIENKLSFIENPIVVAVIDTGINLQHELFDGLLYQNPLEKNGEENSDDDGNGYKDDICGWDFVSGDSDVTDECETKDGTGLDGHGTHVAGIVATEIRKYGLENYIKILPIRAGDKSGTFSATRVINAITYAIKIKKANNLTMVINMSLKNSLDEWGENTRINTKVQEAVKAGIVIVAAAGNDGYESSSSLKTGSPAGLDNVIGVMAYKNAGDNTRNYNYGSAYDLAAPGYAITSASRIARGGNTVTDSYIDKNGTSMASPIVAFMAAVLCINFERDSSMVYDSIVNSSEETTGTVGITNTSKTLLYTAKKANLVAFLQYAPIKKIQIQKVSGEESQQVNSTSPIKYEAYIYKYGSENVLDVNDDLYNDITMYIAKCDDDGNVTDEIVASCQGRIIEFTPVDPGEYIVYAGVSGYSNDSYVSALFYVNYSSIEDAELSIEHDEVKVRINNTYKYSIKNYYKINPDLTVTWSLYDENDVLVINKTGETFSFTPNKKGNYTLICKIGSTTVDTQNIKVYMSENNYKKVIGGVVGGIVILIGLVVLIISCIRTFKKSA